MDDISAQLDSAVQRGNNAVVVRIVKSSGSTPREAGAAMLVTKDGRIAGTIGGGALELESEKLASEVLNTRASGEKEFRLTEGHDEDELGMLCGGDVTVSLQFVDVSDPASVEKARELIALPKKDRVYVFGAGHVAKALVPVLAPLGFHCVVLDSRPEYCTSERFPDAGDVRVMNPEDISEAAEIGPEDYVVIMTHGHADDLLVQSQAMKTPAKYIGVIGSARKTRTLTEKLRSMGYNESDFRNVYAPIGVPVPCETPEEIAVSIAAQLIAVRAGDTEAARGLKTHTVSGKGI